MPAPPSDLVDDLRAETVHRHVFFAMTHSQGDLFVWDGVGDYLLGGDTYLGVGGLASIDGVSDSGDIQNHEIIATLNGAALTDVRDVDPAIRGESVTIVFAWISAENDVVAQRTVFSGEADVLSVGTTEESSFIRVRCRAPLAEWGFAPRAYYTDADQQRRFSGDTGFSFVKFLENASVSGWGLTSESSGGVPTLHLVLNTTSGGYVGRGLYDSFTGEVIGAEGNGINIVTATGNTVRDPATTAATYVEDVSGASAKSSSPFTPGATLQVGGSDCYVDVVGDVRTPAGLYVTRDAADTGRLRKQGTISADGTASADSVQRATSGSVHVAYRAGSGFTFSGDDHSGRVYCNSNGRLVEVTTGAAGGSLAITASITGAGVRTFGASYVEDVTAAACTYGAGGTLQVGGSDCKVSTTGVVLSPGGRRIVKSGGTANEFLRVWT